MQYRNTADTTSNIPTGTVVVVAYDFDVLLAGYRMQKLNVLCFGTPGIQTCMDPLLYVSAHQC